MQQYELEAWLGDDHGLDENELAELLQQADEIEDRFPDPDDKAEKHVALVTAYKLIKGDESVIDELAKDRVHARAAESRALAGLQQAARMAGAANESAFARRAGVDRMTVRKWRDKR